MLELQVSGCLSDDGNAIRRTAERDEEVRMNSLFEEKYDELFAEFNYYVVEHPEFARRIPRDALVVLLDRNDPVFSRENLRRVKNYLQHDDNPDRPVLYVQVGRLAPVKSRLRDLRLMTRVPDYVI